MATLRALVVLGLLACLSYTMAQQCDKAFEDFQQCIRDSMKPGQRQGQGQGPPDFADMKKKADQCFTSNNCEPPQFGKGGRPGASGSSGEGPRPFRGGSGDGQRGGRGGSNDDGSSGGRWGGRGQSSGNGLGEGRGGRDGSSDDNGDRRKCFQSVSNKTKDYMLQCIRKADPSFNFPEGKGHGGFGGPGGFGDHGGHGPFGGRGGPGGPGGPGGAGPHGFPGGPQGGKSFLLEACKNDAAAADKVNACLATAFPKPDTAQMKKAFEDHCKAKSDCEAKLGACKDVMEKRRQAMCTCGQEVQSKRQEFMQQEPTCASQQNNSGTRRPGQGKQRDCSQKPQDPCQQGFDAVMKQGESRRRPNGGN